MGNDSTYHKHLEGLSSHDPDLVIKASHALGDLGDPRAVPALIELLDKTDNHRIRNAVAFALGELGDQRALQPIARLLTDPKTEGYRGTLVYSLRGLDCSPILPLLVDLVAGGNFEVSHEAFMAIESIESEIEPGTLEVCIRKIKKALPQANSDNGELLRELRELFEGY
jgi:HEAT repeat protein